MKSADPDPSSRQTHSQAAPDEAIQETPTAERPVRSLPRSELRRFKDAEDELPALLEAVDGDHASIKKSDAALEAKPGQHNLDVLRGDNAVQSE